MYINMSRSISIDIYLVSFEVFLFIVMVINNINIYALYIVLLKLRNILNYKIR